LAHSLVLARKWRPKKFAELVGQDHVVRALSNALTQNRLHHAYLFTGTRGVGKTTIARILAKALNCTNGITATPCGQCIACQAIDSGSFADLIELDAASNTQVDAMRDLMDNLQYSPVYGRYKVYLIDEVHMLSKSAFNAMLKTLEEPPAHVIFILATTDPQKIPVTVLSRCLQFCLKQITPALIVTRLTEILVAEQIRADQAALKLLAHAAKGSMRDALSLLDQAIAFCNHCVEEAGTRAMLGVVGQDHLFALLQALEQKEGGKLLAIAGELEAAGVSFDSVLQDLAAWLHQIALAQTVPQAIDETLPQRDQILALAGQFSREDVQLFYQIALHGRQDLGLAPDEYSGFSMTLLRMLAFLPDRGEKPERVTKSTGKHAKTPIPPVEQRNVSKPQTISLSPNETWLTLVKELKLTGMTRMLAQYCEASEFLSGKINLCLPPEHRHLLEKTYQEKLKAQLETHLGNPVELTISLAVISGDTLAARQENEQRTRQSSAIDAIESDPFVQELIEEFDASLDVKSIKPNS
jgi:DNA polymerase-3 subunit gamma/tau